MQRDYRYVYFNIEDIEVKNVFVSDLPDSRISFDVILEVQLSGKREGRKYSDDDEYPWLRVKCEGDLGTQLTDIHVTMVMWCDSRVFRKDPLSDSLVPMIRKEDLDRKAEEILAKYGSEQYRTDLFINPRILAENMGLDIWERNIKKARHHRLCKISYRGVRNFF